MNKWIVGTAVAGLIAIPAFAAMEGHHGMGHMKGPQTRAEVEAKVKEHFAEVDANKDGAISKAEADAYHDKTQSERNTRMFEEIDADKNGQISRTEFDAHHDGRGRGPHRGHGGHGGHGGPDRMFTEADSNGDGSVTFAEAQTKALAMFDKADADKNGTVTPEERRAAWMSWKGDRKDGQGKEVHHH